MVHLFKYLKKINTQVIVSAAAKTQLQNHERSELRQRKGQKKRTGVYKLNPDYKHFMKPDGKSRSEAECYPSSDFDLAPYRRRWIAWMRGLKKSCDFGNEETCRNRYMLVGRPQIGKTGDFFRLFLKVKNYVHRCLSCAGSPPLAESRIANIHRAGNGKSHKNPNSC